MFLKLNLGVNFSAKNGVKFLAEIGVKISFGVNSFGMGAVFIYDLNIYDLRFTIYDL